MTEIQEAAERERLIRILMRFIPAEYQWIVRELARLEPKAPAEIASVVHEFAKPRGVEPYLDTPTVYFIIE